MKHTNIGHPAFFVFGQDLTLGRDILCKGLNHLFNIFKYLKLFYKETSVVGKTSRREGENYGFSP